MADKAAIIFNEEQSGCSNKRHTILVSWASVSTALLLVGIIVGCFYIADLKSDVKVLENRTYDHVKTYEERMQAGEEEIVERGNLDADRHTEFIYQKTGSGNIHSVLSADYRKSIAYIFVPSNEECYLLSDLPVTWEQTWNAAMNGTISKSSDREVVTYARSDRPVTDYSFLPGDISAFCHGKPTYWLSRDFKTEDNRVARRVRISLFWGAIVVEWD